MCLFIFLFDWLVGFVYDYNFFPGSHCVEVINLRSLDLFFKLNFLDFFALFLSYKRISTTSDLKMITLFVSVLSLLLVSVPSTVYLLDGGVHKKISILLTNSILNFFSY